MQSVGRKLPQNCLPPKHPDLRRKDPVTHWSLLLKRERREREGRGSGRREGGEKREEGWRKDRPSILKPQLCIGILYLFLQVYMSHIFLQLVTNSACSSHFYIGCSCHEASLLLYLPLALHSTALGSSRAVSATSPSSSTSLSTMETQLN